NVMETILQPYKGLPDFTPTKQLEAKLDEVEQLVVREIGVQYHSEFTSVDDLNSMQCIMHRIASAYVKVYLEYDITHYKGFRIVELENAEDYMLDFPISINGKEESICLFGIIDRVDEVLTTDDQVKTRIVDYKTGGDSITFRQLEKV